MKMSGKKCGIREGNEALCEWNRVVRGTEAQGS